MNDCPTRIKGLIGTISSFGGIGISLAAVEAWLRVGSLLIGIAVGLASLHSILKGKKQ